MAKYKNESYNSRNRLSDDRIAKEANDLRLKKIELESFKDLVIKEYIEQQRKKTSLTRKILDVFKKSK